VALMRGDKLLVVHSDGSTRLWRCQLSPDAAIHPLEDPASQDLLKRMQHDLFGYVQAATTDLVKQRAGPARAPAHFSPPQ
jgi:hypothetical protein